MLAVATFPFHPDAELLFCLLTATYQYFQRKTYIFLHSAFQEYSACIIQGCVVGEEIQRDCKIKDYVVMHTLIELKKFNQVAQAALILVFPN